MQCSRYSFYNIIPHTILFHMCIERSLIQKWASFNPSRHHKSAGFECVRVCIQKAFIARYIGALTELVSLYIGYWTLNNYYYYYYYYNKWYSNKSEWTVLNCIGCYRLICCVWFSEPFYFIREIIYILWN